MFYVGSALDRPIMLSQYRAHGIMYGLGVDDAHSTLVE